MTAKRKGRPRGDTRVSLAPLDFEDALRDLAATGKPADHLTDEEIQTMVEQALNDDELDTQAED